MHQAQASVRRSGLRAVGVYFSRDHLMTVVVLMWTAPVFAELIAGAGATEACQNNEHHSLHIERS